MVWHLSLPLMDSGVASFITTDEQLQLSRGCYFPMQTMFPEGFPFPFLSLIAMRESLEPSYRYNIFWTYFMTL